MPCIGVFRCPPGRHVLVRTSIPDCYHLRIQFPQPALSEDLLTSIRVRPRAMLSDINTIRRPFTFCAWAL